MGDIPAWSVYKVPILLGAVSLILVLFSITLLVKSAQPTTPIQFSVPEVATQSATIKIDVEGAVVNPGLYHLAIGSRVEDAIVLAGGFSLDADSERIAKELNRAAKISDGAKLYIPKKGDATVSQASGVSINGSSQAQLEELAGVGPATAKKIIDNRPYQTLEELVTKKAMGQNLFDKLKNQLTL